MSTEEEYTAERLDGKGEVKGKFYEDQQFIDGESCVDVSIIVTEDFEMIRIKPETLRQTGGKLFDRVKALEEIMDLIVKGGCGGIDAKYKWLGTEYCQEHLDEKYRYMQKLRGEVDE